jgi:hypothetical protein
MKGMFCGPRVLGPVGIAAVVAAAAPALARADVINGQLPATPAVPSAAVSTPTVPALPAASPVPTPATPAPAAAAVAAATAAVPTVVGGAATVDRATGTITIKPTPKAKVTVSPAKGAVTVKATPKATASVSPTKGDIHVGASAVVEPAKQAVAKANTTATKVKPVKKAAAKAGRVLAGGSDTDPLYGCEGHGWTVCIDQPIQTTPIDNRCYEYPTGTTNGTSDGTTNLPPVSPDFVTFTQGKSVLWMRTDTKMIGLLPYTVMHVKQFIWGLEGAGSIDASTYKLGHDFQDTWDVAFPFGSTDAVEKLTQDILLVNSGTAPNEYYTEHFLVDPNGNITIKWHIVCHKGDRGDDMHGNPHDSSGNYDKYKHNHDDYHGYNDDDPGSWDQGD